MMREKKEEEEEEEGTVSTYPNINTSFTFQLNRKRLLIDTNVKVGRRDDPELVEELLEDGFSDNARAGGFIDGTDAIDEHAIGDSAFGALRSHGQHLIKDTLLGLQKEKGLELLDDGGDGQECRGARDDGSG